MAIETGVYLTDAGSGPCVAPCDSIVDGDRLAFDQETGVSNVFTVGATPLLLHVMRNAQGSTLSIERVLGGGPGDAFAPVILNDRQLRFSGALNVAVAAGAAVVLPLSGRYRVQAQPYKCPSIDLLIAMTPLFVPGDYVRLLSP